MNSAGGFHRRLMFYADFFDRCFPGGINRFDLGEQTAGAAGRDAGTIAAFTLAAISSGERPAVRSATMDAKILPTSSADRGARCVICRGLASPSKGSSLLTPFGRPLMAFWKFVHALPALSPVSVA